MKYKIELRGNDSSGVIAEVYRCGIEGWVWECYTTGQQRRMAGYKYADEALRALVCWIG